MLDKKFAGSQFNDDNGNKIKASTIFEIPTLNPKPKINISARKTSQQKGKINIISTFLSFVTNS